MILVDSSVWIDYFTGTDNWQAEVLETMLGVEDVVAGDLILTEVLQGFKDDQDCETAKSLFDSVAIFDMLGRGMALASAQNYRSLRKRGITIRKTADVIIATFCIERQIPLLFSDRDFKPFVIHMGLVEAMAV